VPESLLYLSRDDVRALGISPAEARVAVLKAFRDFGEGRNQSIPKSSLMLNIGHGFQAMVAASSAEGIAMLKWVGMTPVQLGSTVPAVSALICVNDATTGVPLAVLDGDEITLIRTAAMSAAAASKLAPDNPRTIGFVGCGLQAHAHLAAFHDLYPGLERVLALSRTQSSGDRLVEAARARHLGAETVTDANELLAISDIVISTVPGGPGQQAFLDARLMKPVAFASAVDVGRSWLPASLPAFDILATDSLTQSSAPYDNNGNYVDTVSYTRDLVELSRENLVSPNAARSLFCFRGFAVADLALAHLVLQRSRKFRRGDTLAR
jgi:alanine dehydrogenase